MKLISILKPFQAFLTVLVNTIAISSLPCNNWEIKYDGLLNLFWSTAFLRLVLNDVNACFRFFMNEFNFKMLLVLCSLSNSTYFLDKVNRFLIFFLRNSRGSYLEFQTWNSSQSAFQVNYLLESKSLSDDSSCLEITRIFDVLIQSGCTMKLSNFETACTLKLGYEVGARKWVMKLGHEAVVHSWGTKLGQDALGHEV